MLQPMTNVEALVKAADANCSENSSAPSVITAGGSLDNVKVTGQSIDTQGYSSIALVTHYLVALTQDKTLSLAHELQESADNSTWDTAEVIEAATVYATGGTGGSNERGVVEFAVNQALRKRYIRFNVTADLSHTSTDTCSFASVAILGGAQVVPAA